MKLKSYLADCPQNAQLPPGARSSLASGANAAPTAPRAWGEQSSWRDRTDDRRRSKEGRPRRDDYAGDDRVREKHHDYPGTGRRRSRSRSRYRDRLDYGPRESGGDSFREKKRRLD